MLEVNVKNYKKFLEKCSVDNAVSFMANPINLEILFAFLPHFISFSKIILEKINQKPDPSSYFHFLLSKDD